MGDGKESAGSGKRKPQDIPGEPKRRRIIFRHGSNSSPDDRKIHDVVSKLKQSAIRITENTRILIAKKRRDKQEESDQGESVDRDQENFLRLFEKLIAVTNESQEREAVIDRIEEIEAIGAILKMIQSFSNNARDYKAAATAKMAQFDKEIKAIEDSDLGLRRLVSKVVDKRNKDFNEIIPFSDFDL